MLAGRFVSAIVCSALALFASVAMHCAAQTGGDASPMQSATDPSALSWNTEYFEGDASCTEPATVWDVANAAKWKPLSLKHTASPDLRTKQLWIRVFRSSHPELVQSGVAAFSFFRPTTVYYGLESDFSAAATPDARSGQRRNPTLLNPTVIDLPEPWPAGQPWYVCFASKQEVSSHAISLQPTAAHREETLQRARWVVACFAVMFTMMLSAIFFGWTLKDRVYLLYVGHVAAFMVFQAVRNQMIPNDMISWAWIASLIGSGLSVLFAWHFLSVFMMVDRKLPRVDRWLRRFAWGVLASACALPVTVSLLGRAHLVTDSVLAVMNALTMIVCAGALGAVVYLTWKRQRFAGYLLIGWTPLFVVAVMSAVEVITGAAQPIWGQWVLPAAAFEALVLSFGMAARTLDLRNERDLARRSAEIDPLTGVLNRRGVFNLLEQLQADVAQSERRHALLYCDLDDFKRINDRYGHDAGDACLQHFVACAQAVLRSEDAVGRLGGEEFALLLHAKDETEALAVAERLRAKLASSAATWRDTAIPFTASIGVAFIDAKTPFAVALSNADAALYRAKDGGRDRVCLA